MRRHDYNKLLIYIMPTIIYTHIHTYFSAITEKTTGVLKTSNGNGGDNMKSPDKKDTTDNKDSKTTKTPRRGQ